MDAALFDLAADQLEQHTDFSRIEARGTLRIALKDSGLDARSITPGQRCVVFDKVMPIELERRGVKDATEVCSAVIEGLANAPASADKESSTDPDGVFRRLGGG